MYYRRNRNLPWLTKEANSILSTFLLPSDFGLEFGSGRSTIWFSKKLRQLISIESNPEWFERVSKILDENSTENVTYVLVDDIDSKTTFEDYTNCIKNVEKESVDFALVDGVFRGEIANYILPLVKSGGIIVIDNVNWFLPSDSKSPNSLPLGAKINDPLWQSFNNETATWRRIWTSNGVTDTAFFFKP